MVQDAKPKVLLILERSEDFSTQVGIVKDCHGSMPIDMSTCDVVGTWSRFDVGTFYVELTTPVDALQDTLIQLISERVKSNEMAVYPAYTIDRTPAPHTSRRSSSQGQESKEPAPTFNLDGLRAKLGR